MIERLHLYNKQRLISMAYDTNFDITFTLDSDTGTLVIREDDHECGF